MNSMKRSSGYIEEKLFYLLHAHSSSHYLFALYICSSNRISSIHHQTVQCEKKYKQTRNPIQRLTEADISRHQNGHVKLPKTRKNHLHHTH